MPIVQPYIETAEERFEQTQWVQREAMRNYVRCQRLQAEVNQVLSVWLRGPRCGGCQASDPFESDAMPTIWASTWEEDVAIEVDDEMVDEIKKALANGDDPAWPCIRCQCALRPWDGDDVYIVRRHLEEDHSLPTETVTSERLLRPCGRWFWSLTGISASDAELPLRRQN